MSSVQQLGDHLRLSREKSRKVYASPPSTYIKWVNNTATEHFGGYCAFAFITCLLGNGDDFLPNSEIKYVAQDCCRRRAVALRMVNDYGSLARDRRDMNLNSVFFPEFAGENKDDKELRNELIKLARYEKESSTLAFGKLEKACGSRFRQAFKAVSLFYYSCEYYTDLYQIKNDLL